MSLEHVAGEQFILKPETYRPHFPILRSKIHIANCTQAPLSLDVIEAIDRYKHSLMQDGIDWDRWIIEVDLARAAFAELIGADERDVAVLSSVSDAISSIASCLPIRGRQRIVTTVDEFPTVGQVWLASAQHGRADVAFIRSTDGFYTREVIEPYLRQDTAILSIHFVSYYHSVLQDIRELAHVAHQHGALLLIDAYQGLGTIPLNVHETAADIVVSGTLKYLLGIPGIAFMYVQPGLSDSLRPAMTGWLGSRDPFQFDTTVLEYMDGARRFDMGTPPVISAYAARAGMRLIQEVGVSRIRQHTQRLSQRVLHGAAKRGLQVVSPPDVARKGAATAIRVGAHSHEIEEEMSKRDIIVSSRADAIRIAPHFFTTLEDVDTALDELQSVCARISPIPKGRTWPLQRPVCE